MAFSKKTSIPTVEKAHDIGLRGSAADLLTAAAEAKAYVRMAKDAHERYDRKSHGGMSLMHSLEKHWRLRDAYRESIDLPYKINSALIEGSIKAFFDGHPENIQTIINYPEDFLQQEGQHPHHLAVAVVLALTLMKPAFSVPVLAIYKLDPQDQGKFLNDVLYELLNEDRFKDHAEAGTAALLEAGADVSHIRGRILATALYRGHSGKVIDMLTGRGATYQDALERIKGRPDHYREADMATSIAYHKYRRDTEARIKEQQDCIEEQQGYIKELEETVMELTMRVQMEENPILEEPEDAPEVEPEDAPPPKPGAPKASASSAFVKRLHKNGY